VKNKFENKKLFNKITFVVIILLSISCSGLKDFDNKPEPIGGEERVREVIKETLGPGYMGLVGQGRVTFDITIRKNGRVK
jgi:hypothetical protein